MVYVDQRDLGSFPYYDAWARSKSSEQLLEVLDYLWEKYVPQCLAFILHDKGRDDEAPVPAKCIYRTDVNMVSLAKGPLEHRVVMMRKTEATPLANQTKSLAAKFVQTSAQQTGGAAMQNHGHHGARGSLRGTKPRKVRKRVPLCLGLVAWSNSEGRGTTAARCTFKDSLRKSIY